MSNCETGRETSPMSAEACPICLTDVTNASERAHVMPCLHAFCFSCIRRWAQLRRECPLCKGIFTSVLYNVHSNGRHEELVLSPLQSIKSRSIGSNDVIGDRPAAVTALLRDARLQYEILRSGSAPCDPRFPPRSRVSSGHRSIHNNRSNPERHPHNEPQRAADGTLVEPRPYFHRVQRQMQSRTPNAVVETLQLEVDDAQLWRRNVYSNGLWALPVTSSASGSSVGVTATGPAAAALRSGRTTVLAAMVARERRVDEWATRELRALLRQQDVLVVKGLTLSLLKSHAAEDISEAQQRPRQAASPQDALQPFLRHHAAHFWHELCAFASTPFTLPTYDRLVRYGTHQEAAAASAAVANIQTSGSGTAPQTAEQAAAGHIGSLTAGIAVRAQPGSGTVAALSPSRQADPSSNSAVVASVAAQQRQQSSADPATAAAFVQLGISAKAGSAHSGRCTNHFSPTAVGRLARESTRSAKQRRTLQSCRHQAGEILSWWDDHDNSHSSSQLRCSLRPVTEPDLQQTSFGTPDAPIVLSDDDSSVSPAARPSRVSPARESGAAECAAPAASVDAPYAARSPGQSLEAGSDCLDALRQQALHARLGGTVQATRLQSCQSEPQRSDRRPFLSSSPLSRRVLASMPGTDRTSTKEGAMTNCCYESKSMRERNNSKTSRKGRSRAKKGKGAGSIAERYSECSLAKALRSSSSSESIRHSVPVSRAVPQFLSPEDDRWQMDC